jgi:hypothetical protein
MSSILYYSNQCEHSKRLLQTLAKSPTTKDMHFICIDRRVKDPSGKIYIVLETGQRIIMPENVSRVPALLLLNDNYKVLYGEAILQQLKPRVEAEMRVATQNHMEPNAFSFSSAGGCVASDQYSFLDMDSESLKATGDGGMRQMHNYVDLNFADKVHTPLDEAEYKRASKMPEGMTVEQLQQQRDMDMKKI